MGTATLEVYSSVQADTLHQPADKRNTCLADIDKKAVDMFSRLVKQLAEKENVTEELKAIGRMLWAQKMNNIRSRAMGVVNTQIIYN